MEHQYLQKHLYILAAIGLAILGVTAHLYAWGPLQAVDSGGCRGTYMYPSYARIKSFDETHTEYALKYSLYLYREQGKDPVPEDGQGFTQLTGVPALFIPGMLAHTVRSAPLRPSVPICILERKPRS